MEYGASDEFQIKKDWINTLRSFAKTDLNSSCIVVFLASPNKKD